MRSTRAALRSWHPHREGKPVRLTVKGTLARSAAKQHADNGCPNVECTRHITRQPQAQVLDGDNTLDKVLNEVERLVGTTPEGQRNGCVNCQRPEIVVVAISTQDEHHVLFPAISARSAEHGAGAVQTWSLPLAITASIGRVPGTA